MFDIYKTKKPPKPAVKVFPDGREVCSDTKAGRDEYRSRTKQMWERQGKRCCLEGKAPGCPGRMRFDEASFDHEAGRGFNGSKRDDRIEIDGKPVNGAAHFACNGWKASRRVDYSNTP